MFGKYHSESTKLLIAKKKSIPVQVFDILGNLKYTFESSVQAAKFFKVHKGTIGRYIKNKKLFKDTFLIKRI
jgi:group I intron endonuclease